MPNLILHLELHNHMKSIFDSKIFIMIFLDVIDISSTYPIDKNDSMRR